MHNSEFTTLACRTLNHIAESLEEQDPEGMIEVDLHDGILNVVTGQGTFVINKHSAAKEIWLSSPASGPSHFAYRDGKWLSKNGKDLFVILKNELGIVI